MVYTEIANTEDIPDGMMKMVMVRGKEILLVNVEGSYYAIGNRCTHANGNLSKGILLGTTLTCPKHGSQFDVTTGRAIRGPKMMFLRFKTKNEPTYEVKVKDGKILVKIP